MQWMDGAAYFARAVSYGHNMFMKCASGVRLIKLFFSVADEEAE